MNPDSDTLDLLYNSNAYTLTLNLAEDQEITTYDDSHIEFFYDYYSEMSYSVQIKIVLIECTVADIKFVTQLIEVEQIIGIGNKMEI